MEYLISRFEKILNEDTTVKEIFIAVKLTKDADIWEQGYWLTEDEKNLVVVDEQNLGAIVDKVALIGEAALDAYKIAPPVIHADPIDPNQIN